MDDYQNNGQNTEEEIDLRELFLVIWNKKAMIISITLITAILVGLFSVFVLTPVYHSRLNIIINMPASYSTKYGDYELPITSNEQYISLITSSDIIKGTIKDMGYDSDTTVESIRDRITVDIPESKSNAVQNSFYVRVSANNPAEAKKLAQTLYDNYIVFIDLLVVEGALDYHINNIDIAIQSNEVSLDSMKDTLANNEELLAFTPQTINQREVMDEIQQGSITSDYIILENIINPNYTKIELDIIENKQSISEIENIIKVNNSYLLELYDQKARVNSYKVDGDYSGLDSDFVRVTKTNLYLPSDPIVPSRKTSPSNVRNAIIGALLGGMVAVFLVLIREYWFESDIESKEKSN